VSLCVRELVCVCVFYVIYACRTCVYFVNVCERERLCVCVCVCVCVYDI
jgi:hypothetical protein